MALLYPGPVTYPSVTSYPGEQAPAEAVTPVDPVQPWAVTADVTALLGVRLPTDVDVNVHLRRAHAVALTWLGKVYPRGVPAFTGAALKVVADAEASLAAAGIMTRLLAQVDGADWTAVQSWRADAQAVLTAAVPGFDPSETDPDGSGPLLPVIPSPVAVSSRGPYVGVGLVRDPVFRLPVEALDADPWPY